MTSPKLSIPGFIVAVALGLLVSMSPALAQSPSPNARFIDVAAGGTTVPGGASGVVVEGLGGNACAYSLSSLESSTVSFVNRGIITWSEITPQSGCNSITGYENEVSALINYVEANASGAGTYWDGIMIDEESDFGFSVSQLQTLNNYIDSAMLSTPGRSWWSTENFSSQGAWSQTDFNNLTGSSHAAPQIATSYMVSLTNSFQSSTSAQILVTWSTTYPAPFNSGSYADGQVNGLPYEQAFGDGVYWDNQFVAV